MTGSLRLGTNCGSGIPVLVLGVIATASGIHHSSAPCLALGMVMVAFPAIVLAILRVSARGVRVASECPASAFEGDTVEVRVVLRNNSRFPIFLPRVSEVFAPAAHEQKDILFPYRVRPGETVEERYRGDCILPRGVYPLGPIAISISDPLGWFQIHRIQAGHRKLKVYPRFQAFGVKEESGDSASRSIDDITRAGLGESNEFLTVREYRPGDPLRRVHWRLTAHRGFPVVRETTRTTAGDIFILLDLYRYAFLGVGRGSSLEQAVKIAASLSASALRRGRQVKLAARGSSDVRVGPGTSIAHLQTILDALVLLRPDGAAPLEDLLEEVSHDLRQGSTVVIDVSPYLRGSERFEGQVAALRRAGVRVVLVVFDDSTFRSLYGPQERDGALESHISRMARLGAEPFIIQCGASLAAVFEGRPESPRRAAVGKGAR